MLRLLEYARRSVGEQGSAVHDGWRCARCRWPWDGHRALLCARFNHGLWSFRTTRKCLVPDAAGNGCAPSTEEEAHPAAASTRLSRSWHWCAASPVWLCSLPLGSSPAHMLTLPTAPSSCPESAPAQGQTAGTAATLSPKASPKILSSPSYVCLGKGPGWKHRAGHPSCSSLCRLHVSRTLHAGQPGRRPLR